MTSTRPPLTSLALVAVGLWLLAAYSARPAEAGVIGIDLGSSWFKVAVIQGSRFDLVVNAEGRRKQPVLVGFHRGERMLGRDAERLWARDPSFPVYGYLPQLLGRSANHSAVASQLHHYPYPFADDASRGAICLPDADGDRFAVAGVDGGDGEAALPVETLVAMVLEQAKNTVRDDLGVDVPDVVITVPPSATQHERVALRNAASLAGLNVLALINNGAALALNYALGRTKEELAGSHYVAFYDMGATQSSVSVAYFSHVPGNAKTSKKDDIDLVPQVQIVATAWDETLGGREFDWRLAGYLADVATRQSGVDVRSNRRAMASLVAEARRTKEVLSANAVATAMVEGLVGDFDFRHDVSRKQFEQLCADLLDRVAGPLRAALAQAQISEADLLHVELFGGNTRVPAVQEAVAAALGGRTPDKHLNSDEAAVMGATFFAATTSSTLRIKTQYRLKDVLPFSVQLDVAGGDFDDGFERSQTLIRPNNRLGLKKTVTLRPTSSADIALSLTYAADGTPAPTAGVPLHFADCTVTGVPSVADDGLLEHPKLYLAFRLDKSGVLSLDQATAHYSVEELVAVPRNASAAGEQPPAEDRSEADSDADAESSADDEKDADNAPPQEDSEPAVDMVLSVREKSKSLQIETTVRGIVPLSAAQLRQGKALLAKIQRVEKLKLDTEEARSTLEAFVYEAREQLDDEAGLLARYLTDDERSSLSAQVADATDWLYDDGERADLATLRGKLAELRTVYDKAGHRQQARDKLPAAFAQFNTTTLPAALAGIAESFSSRNISDDERDDFKQQLSTRLAELQTRIAQQEQLALDQDPVVTADDVSKLTAWLTAQARRFKLKPVKAKPVAPKPADDAAESPSEQPVEEEQHDDVQANDDAVENANAATEEEQDTIHEL